MSKVLNDCDDQCDNKCFSLIFLDLNMPIMDGFQAVTIIKYQNVLALTQHS